MNTQTQIVGVRSRSGGPEPVLSVRGLTTEFETSRGTVRAVNDVSFDLMAGETLGIVGESGSGKTATILSSLGLLPKDVGRAVAGSVHFAGHDLLKTPARQLRKFRGRDIGVVFQDPMSSLNPVLTVGDQLMEAVRVHNPAVSRREARRRAIEALDLVGVPHAAKRLDDYPHQYSGGMRQRVMISMAIINGPSIIVADEPTTALDVTIQAQVLEVLRTAREASGAATIMITHDLGVVAEMADRVGVMYGGRMIELNSTADLFARPGHPYTAGLLASTPSIDAVAGRLVPIPGEPVNLLQHMNGCPFRGRCVIGRDLDVCAHEMPALNGISDDIVHLAACHFSEQVTTATIVRGNEETTGAVEAPAGEHGSPANPRSAQPLLTVRELSKTYPVKNKPFGRKGSLQAVTDVDLTFYPGETVALVGESGSGKSTVGRVLAGLTKASGGQITYRGREMDSYEGDERKQLRQELQIVFQDPYASLDPRMTVGASVAEPLAINGGYAREAVRSRVLELLAKVGLPTDFADRYPHQLSGGQRQRVGIARALTLEPRVIVLDEPVSALDVSVQAQVINLLQDIKRDLEAAYLFISHDLSVVHHIADRIAVMYLGRIVEFGTRDEIFSSPAHPYTQALFSAIPVPDPAQRGRTDRVLLTGEIPNPLAPPSGCVFRTRCWKATSRCAEEVPVLTDQSGIGHDTACHYPGIGATPSRVDTTN